jgi:hypothetical protein
LAEKEPESWIHFGQSRAERIEELNKRIEAWGKGTLQGPPTGEWARQELKPWPGEAPAMTPEQWMEDKRKRGMLHGEWDPDLEKKLAKPPTVQDLNRARDEQRRRGVYGPQGFLGLDYSLQSENIEDRRGEHFDALVANTEELKRLNDHLSGVTVPRGGYGFLSGGGAGGGIAQRLGLGGAGGITLPGVGGIDASGTGPGSLNGLAQRLALGGGTGIGPGVPPVPTGISRAPGLAGPLGTRDIPGTLAPAEGGADKAGRGAALYQKLLTAFRQNPPQGVPPDAARFGITKGTPEEWARFGVSVAHAESGFNPRSANTSDPGGSFGVFQYGHGQVPGGDAYDVDASVKAFVRDANSSAASGSLRGGILGQRFSTIGRHPERGAAYLTQAGKLGARPSGPAGDPTVPGDILAQAQQVAHLGPGAVDQFMRAQGYPKDRQWCGDFAASVVKAAGYTPPAGAAVASNWRRFGVPETGLPHPGDIAIANRGVATGATGSHVTFVESYDPTTGRFTGLGGNQRAGFESSFAASGYTFRRPPDREALNRGALNGAMTHKVEGTGSIDVNVSAPAGTRVAAESGGLFKKINMTRQTQMSHAAGGPSTPAGAEFGGP